MLIELAQKYLELEKKGDDWLALCPWHDDSTPSLSINDDVFHCFGCGKKGNAVNFLMLMENCSKKAAIKKLYKGNVTVSKNKKTKLFGKLVKWSQRKLFRSKAAKQYLKKRGIDKKIVIDYGLGFIPAGKLIDFLDEHEVKAKDAKKYRLLSKRNKPFFNDMITVPIHYHGHVYSIYGRTIRDKRLHLYNQEIPCLYNWDNVRHETDVYLVEGIFDALSFAYYGINNFIACYGTEGLKEDFICHIKNSNIKNIIMIPDRDENKAGCEAFSRISSRLLQNGISVQGIMLPQGIKDINHFHTQGLKRNPTLAEFLPAKQPLFPVDFLRKNKITIDNNLLLQSDKSKILQRTYKKYPLFYNINGSTISLTIDGELIHKDNVKLSSHQRRQSFAKKIAEHLDEDDKLIKAIEKDLLLIDDQLQLAREQVVTTVQEKEIVFDVDIEEKANALLKSPKLLSTINDHIGSMGIVEEVHNRTLLYLIATSRRMKKPLSALITAQSASGKSKLVGTILEMMPKDEAREITALTKQAMFYLPEDALKNKFVVITEYDGSRDADYSIRVMQSEQKLTIDTVMKNPVTNQLETITKTVLGPMALVQTTTTAIIDPQNATRMIMLTLDDSTAQTRKIHKYQYRLKMKPPVDVTQQHNEIIQIHQCLQTKLEDAIVVIPYADQIEFPATQVRSRRDNLHFLDLISTVAFLHQHQRKSYMEGEQKIVEANIADYKVAYKLVGGVLDVMSDIPHKSQDLLKQIKSMLIKKSKESETSMDIGDIIFTRRDIREHTTWTDHVIRQFLEPIIQMELIISESKMGQGIVQKYRWNAYEMKVGKQVAGLITPEELKEKL